MSSKSEEESSTLSITLESSASAAAPKIHGRMTCCLLFAVFSATIGSSFQYGYHLAVINSPGKLIEQWYGESHLHMHGVVLSVPVTKWLWNATVAAHPFGGIFGGILAGWLVDKFGRRNTLLYNNGLAILAAVLMTSAKYINVYYLMIIGRFIVGLNCGINAGATPIYLSEIAPISYRGFISSIHQTIITVAILSSLILGLPFILGDVNRWPMLFAIPFVLAVVQLVTLPFCPESPKYSFILKKDKDRAERDLKRLRAIDDVNDELEVMQKEVTAAEDQPKVKLLDLFGREYRWPLTIALTLVLCRQLSAVNIVNAYSTILFTGAGLSGSGPALASVGMGVIKVMTTIATAFLMDCKRCGRRPLLIIGFGLTCVATVCLFFSLLLADQHHSDGAKVHEWAAYAAILFVLVFIVSWSSGPGTIPWFYISEVFSSNARGKANSLSGFCNWISSFIVLVSYPPLNDEIGYYVFLIYSAILAFAFLFTLLAVPETKGKTVKEIREAMGMDDDKSNMDQQTSSE